MGETFLRLTNTFNDTLHHHITPSHVTHQNTGAGSCGRCHAGLPDVTMVVASCPKSSPRSNVTLSRSGSGRGMPRLSRGQGPDSRVWFGEDRVCHRLGLWRLSVEHQAAARLTTQTRDLVRGLRLLSSQSKHYGSKQH